ncbi:ribonuclease III domain-containing protein [Lophiotrema nucula]|uniref:Large ribosomal subunit protein mL44 n=1 Tax=Lophiotrema nucula TaxID=690887 RepID=A0A6A5ZVC9_9PLEO|nr:ribonuclease III domain-containing protein [Lophiotrema nucula]
MKRIRISRCGAQLMGAQAPRRPICPHAAQRQDVAPHHHRIQLRWASSLMAAARKPNEIEIDPAEEAAEESSIDLSEALTASSTAKPPQPPPETLPSPHPSRALKSAKLAALRSRLSLPPRFPLQTLARTLVHPSADPNPHFNNGSMSILGANLLGYYTTEHLLCNYPRLPMSVVFAAQYAYIGPKALATIASEWGIEAAAEPGGEVDPGLLQFKRARSGDEDFPSALKEVKAPWKWNVTTTHKIVSSDEFGSTKARPDPQQLTGQPVPIEEAAQSFVRALIGSLYLHLGSPLVKRFYRDHFLSRHLDLNKLFDFRTPTRDLSRLCAREGFEAPVARLISETGRLSRHPVFVVGVYSGKDKLGEGSGSSLDEARIRAAAAALKGWYLYKPLEVTVPSSLEGEVDTSKWKPNMVDCGEVIV